MVDTGSYNLKRWRDNSFKSFIFALLVFLAFLIIIFIILHALTGKKSNDLNNLNSQEFLKGHESHNNLTTIKPTKNRTSSRTTPTTPTTTLGNDNSDEDETTTITTTTTSNQDIGIGKTLTDLDWSVAGSTPTTPTTLGNENSKEDKTTSTTTTEQDTTPQNILEFLNGKTSSDWDLSEEGSTPTTPTALGYENSKEDITTTTTEQETTPENTTELLNGETSSDWNLSEEGSTPTTPTALGYENSKEDVTTTTTEQETTSENTTEFLNGETSSDWNLSEEGSTSTTLTALGYENSKEDITTTTTEQETTPENTTELLNGETSSDWNLSEEGSTSTTLTALGYENSKEDITTTTTEQETTPENTTELLNGETSSDWNLSEEGSTPTTPTTLDNENSEEDETTPDFLIGETPSDWSLPEEEPGSTCQSGICKRAASVMLAKMNHEDIDPCENTYKFICEGSEPNEKNDFFHYTFKKFINKFTSDGKMEYFADFYKSCNEFDTKSNIIERLKLLERNETDDFQKTVKDLILTQTMPFFDIGVNIYENKFILEITLPGMSYLKTSLKEWSLIHKLKHKCIDEEAEKIVENIELDTLSDNIRTCILNKTGNYIKNFVNEMKEISKIPGLLFLQANVNETDLDILLNILDEVQKKIAEYENYESLANYQNEKTMVTLEELQLFGLNWTQLFHEVSGINFEQQTKIYMRNYMKDIFVKILINIQNQEKLNDLLNLWYNIEFYQNIVIEKEINNRRYYCLDIASQLMPDVSANIIADLQTDDQFYVQTIFQKFKTKLQNSLKQAGITKESLSVMLKRLENIELIQPIGIQVDKGLTVNSDVFPKKLISLMAHNRKTLYSHHGRKVMGNKLLKYFVNAFETKPKTFPPSTFIVYQPGFLFESSDKLPNYVKFAKMGLHLAEQFARHFTENDFESDLNQQEKSLYENLMDICDATYVMDETSYNIENKNLNITNTKKIKNTLINKDIFADNMAFRLTTDTFTSGTALTQLPFLNETYPMPKSFNIVALQGYCQKNTLTEFVERYYDKQLPAPVRIKNIVKSSKFYADTFNCAHNEGKQFPFINQNGRPRP